MTDMIVVAHELGDSFMEQIVKSVPNVDIEVALAYDDEMLSVVLPQARVLVGIRFTESQIAQAHHLEWIHSLSAGVERLPHDTLAGSGITVTNASGAHISPISEHVLAFMLCFARGFPEAFRQQQKRNWDWVQNNSLNPFLLEGATVTVIGLGNLGNAVAIKARGLGMKVLGVRLRPSAYPVYIDDLGGPDKLKEFLPESDFVVNTLPLTKLTKRVIGDAEFQLMKPSAYFINVGRGLTVDQEALIEALNNGVIAGAGLDVTDPEPLPKDSPLWLMEQVLITPHYSSQAPIVMDRVRQLFLENLARFYDGRPLANVVDMSAGY